MKLFKKLINLINKVKKIHKKHYGKNKFQGPNEGD